MARHDRNVIVNGSMVTSPPFASTGAWNSWFTTTLTVPRHRRQQHHSCRPGYG